MSGANASDSRTVSEANRETKRAEPRETSSASLPVFAKPPVSLSPGVHASGASVGSGDERSESPGESASDIPQFEEFNHPLSHQNIWETGV